MPSTVEQLSPSRVKITVEVPFAELKPALDKAYRDIAGQVNIPGFRAGKVPPMVIDQRFGRGVVLQEAINSSLPELYGKAVTENNLNPLGEPEVEVTKLEDNELVEFTAEVDVRPEFEVPDFESITVEVEKPEVGDEQLETQLQTLRERFATQVDVDRPAAEGDVVTLDLVGSKNGEELAEATAEGITYTLGSGGMLDGLDEAVTGKSAGEEVTFTSELVGGPLRGEQADIKVTVQKVQQQELPEIDDEFAQLVSEFDSVEEMKADLSENLVRMSRLEQAANARDKVLEAVIEKVEMDLPEKLIEAEVQARHEQINGQLAQAGLTLDQYLEDGETEQTAEEFWAEVDTRSRDALKAQLVLDKIADDREVGVDQNDLTQHIIRKAQQSGTSPEQEAQHMMEHNHMAEWMTEIRRGKALALMVEAAKVTGPDGEDLNLANLRGDGTYADPDAEAAEAEAAEAEAGETEAGADESGDKADEAKADDKA
ncbi:trigger factor [Propionibacteriaceae bacterium ES.041]|uniref:trigger factor n=1 Tax=Enemella evansiae TaxID=2016499 RepID=UPI000B96B91C|nr:trigger factor [Enemella evansiae]OYN94375.1 trigger factor [Enemella evansiae]OYO04523.1 trigger factor [Enemella evansiae]PFG66459.1 trigger factor [Propionibacteriaceae bacterium ES.041]TDO87949.1 trigger factor [Enemella evansiae]